MSTTIEETATERLQRLESERSAEAEALVLLKDLFYTATAASGAAARTGVLDSRHLDRVLEADHAVRRAAEAFRRRWFPRAHRLVVAQGQIFTISATGRSIRTVWEREATA